MDVILSRLELTNRPLSTSEDARLRSYASTVNSQIQDVDLRLQQVIESLNRERAKLLRQKKRCQSVLSPLRRFPVELLGEIFSWVLETNSSNVISLSRLCRLWRDASIACPSLWAHLVFPPETTGDTGYGFETESLMLNFFATCVERAQSQKMSLSVDAMYDDMPLLLSKILSAAASVNWSFACLSASLPEEFLPFLGHLSANPQHFKSLTKLHLVATESTLDDTIPGEFNLIPLVSLQDLAIDFSWPEFIDTARIPWEQLTSLTMTIAMSSLRYLDILRECSNLQKCNIRPDDPMDSTDMLAAYEMEKVVLPHLKSLDLHHTGYDVPIYTLLPIMTPVLEDFTFAFDLFPSESDELLEFENFIRRNASSLHKLSMPGAMTTFCDLPFPDLIQLKTLRITRPYEPSENQRRNLQYGHVCLYDQTQTIEELFLDHSRTDPGPGCPSLEFLEIVNHPALLAESQASLVDAISSRCGDEGKMNGNLRRVFLSVWDNIAVSDDNPGYRALNNRLKYLQERGLVLDVPEPLGLYL